MTTHDSILALVKGGHMACLSGNALAVLMVYISHADVSGAAWPALETVCRLSGIKSPQNVCTARRQLIDMGLMTLVRRTRLSTVYKVMLAETVQKSDNLKTARPDDQTIQKMDSLKNGQSENQTIHKLDGPVSGLQTVQKLDQYQSEKWTQKQAIEANQRSKDSSEVVPTTKPTSDTSPIVLTFPCARRETFELREALVSELSELFPAVDVLAVCREALNWCRSNPKKVKTAARMRSWLGSQWLAKAQDRGGRRSGSKWDTPAAADEGKIVDMTAAEAQALWEAHQ